MTTSLMRFDSGCYDTVRRKCRGGKVDVKGREDGGEGWVPLMRLLSLRNMPCSAQDFLLWLLHGHFVTPTL